MRVLFTNGPWSIAMLCGTTFAAVMGFFILARRFFLNRIIGVASSRLLMIAHQEEKSLELLIRTCGWKQGLISSCTGLRLILFIEIFSVRLSDTVTTGPGPAIHWWVFPSSSVSLVTFSLFSFSSFSLSSFSVCSHFEYWVCTIYLYSSVCRRYWTFL